jgi:hypothetical protein
VYLDRGHWITHSYTTQARGNGEDCPGNQKGDSRRVAHVCDVPERDSAATDCKPVNDIAPINPLGYGSHTQPVEQVGRQPSGDDYCAGPHDPAAESRNDEYFRTDQQSDPQPVE